MLVPCVFKLVASCRKALAPPPLSYQQLKRGAFINSYTPLNYTNINRLLALSYAQITRRYVIILLLDWIKPLPFSLDWQAAVLRVVTCEECHAPTRMHTNTYSCATHRPRANYYCTKINNYYRPRDKYITSGVFSRLK